MGLAQAVPYGLENKRVLLSIPVKISTFLFWFIPKSYKIDNSPLLKQGVLRRSLVNIM
jgi:hypothetical protein